MNKRFYLSVLVGLAWAALLICGIRMAIGAEPPKAVANVSPTTASIPEVDALKKQLADLQSQVKQLQIAAGDRENILGYYNGLAVACRQATGWEPPKPPNQTAQAK